MMDAGTGSGINRPWLELRKLDLPKGYLRGRRPFTRVALHREMLSKQRAGDVFGSQARDFFLLFFGVFFPDIGGVTEGRAANDRISRVKPVSCSFQ